MTKPANNHKPDSAEAALPAASEIASPGTSAKNPAAVLLGRLGGKKGGPARARKLTPQQRSEIARKASLARWAKHRQQ